MKQRKIVQALVLGLAMGSFGSAAFAEGPDPDRVWVKFKPGAKAQAEQALINAGARFHYRFDDLDAFAVSVPAQALQGLRRNPNIEYIEPDVVRHPMAQTRPYGIDLVRAPQVWSQGVTGNGALVCVIDSGIHAAHEDFQGVHLAGGHPSGWNTDTCGHGSHVAGTIAAKDNNVGVVGVNTGNISLFIVKVFDGANCGWSYSSTLVDAAQRCANAGAKVINMSLGGSFSSTTERNAFQNLYDNGVLSIAAAGNGGNTQHSYPASYDSVISVAALDQNKQHASFSQRNNQVELAAPGVSVLSTVPFESASTVVDGTSYIVSALDGSYQGSASAALVDGGRCLSTGSWAGRVVLCERGDISFADKARNVANSGGVAAIIYNNVPGGFSGTLGSGAPAIPVVSMTQEDGQFLKGNKLGKTAAVSTVPNNQGNGYAFYDGTSMATPHVAGVAALIWSANPGWTNAQIREALAVTAEDLGSAGRDNSYGWGLIRADAALAYLQGGGGGDPDPVVVPPSNLSASVLKSRGQTTGVALSWTAGTASHVDVYRGTSKVAAGITNGGSYTDGYVGAKRERVTYQVCVKDSTSACSNQVTVQF
ncbi:MAG: S8 family serine peptidase [Rehaibacterium terrae]|uniref:S8 family serine peptidase n=1 Tax=Rehaibacterium terrae TaxID=1341696 RepID=UPI00391C6092